jgi:tripartite-type tricarboxylate transporter receptor subunit TctC
LPVKSIRELIALAKARPGDLNYGSGPTGGSTHLAMELFKSMAAANILRVPYKGASPQITALINGEVQVAIEGAPMMPHVKTGRLRALAITGSAPSALFPGLPTIAASGVPGYEATVMSGMFAPAKTPAAIMNRLYQESARLLNATEVRERFLSIGVEVVAGTPDQFAAAIRSQVQTLAKVIKEADIRAD